MKSHITLEITYGEGINSMVIGVIYLIVDNMLPYNIILGLPHQFRCGYLHHVSGSKVLAS